jgi:hypothetical protein
MWAFAVQASRVLHKQFEPCLQDQECMAIREARKLICPAERNMLREMYNFDRHAARVPVFYLYKLSYVVIVKTKDKSNWAD